KELPPLLMRLPAQGRAPTFQEILLEELRAQNHHPGVEEVLAYELSLYDIQPPSYVGLRQDFIAGARLDNLLSCYVGLTAFLASLDSSKSRSPRALPVLVAQDHEEVGSCSHVGADGPFLRSILERI